MYFLLKGTMMGAKVMDIIKITWGLDPSIRDTESSSDYVLNKKELKSQPLLCIKNNAGADPTV